MPRQTVLNECLGFVEKVICLFVSRKIYGKSPLNICIHIFIDIYIYVIYLFIYLFIY